MPTSKVFVADGNYYMHRIHNVLQKHIPRSFHTSMMTQLLGSTIGDAVACNCTHLMVAFDAPVSFRKKLYPDYKANREGNEREEGIPSVGSMIADAMKTLTMAGIKAVQIEGLEGDDILGSARKTFPEAVRIVNGTRDKDLLGHVSDELGVQQYWPTEKILLDERAVVKHFGMQPSQVLNYLSIVGDKVDNIPSIGVTSDRAKKWFRQYGKLSQAMAADKDIRRIMKTNEEQFKFNKTLIRLKEVDLGLSMEDVSPGKVSKDLGDMVKRLPAGLDQLTMANRSTKHKGLFRR